MRFLVMGAGSIGSVVGCLLHLGGHDVCLLGKGPHAEAVTQRGLKISGIWGNFELKDIPAATDVEMVKACGFQPEWTLLSVKSYDTEAALRDLMPILPNQRGIISLQNGLGNVEAISAAAPGKAVGGRVIFGAVTVEPGHVEVTVCADDVLLGPAHGGPVGVEAVVAAFRGSRIPCRYEPEILSYIWDKVLYNACLNALATLLQTNYGSLADDPGTREIMRRLVSEFYAVAGAEGVKLVSETPEAYIKRLEEDLLPPTREHRSSMQEDIERGRRTEIDALNGAVYELGRKHCIETPANELLTHLTHFLEKRGQT